MLEWDDSFSIGVDKIDAQHKQLFCKVKQLSLLLKDGAECSDLRQSADFMKEYFQQHMQHEEDLMESVGYPHLDVHPERHAAFMDMCIDMHMAIALGDRELIEDVLEFLETWLVDHVAMEDAQIGRYMISHGVVV